MTRKESEIFIKQIFEIDDWIASDSEINKSIKEYLTKLSEIKSTGDKYKLRYKENNIIMTNLEFLKVKNHRSNINYPLY